MTHDSFKNEDGFFQLGWKKGIIYYYKVTWIFLNKQKKAQGPVKAQGKSKSKSKRQCSKNIKNKPNTKKDGDLHKKKIFGIYTIPGV